MITGGAACSELSVCGVTSVFFSGYRTNIRTWMKTFSRKSWKASSIVRRENSLPRRRKLWIWTYKIAFSTEQCKTQSFRIIYKNEIHICNQNQLIDLMTLVTVAVILLFWWLSVCWLRWPPPVPPYSPSWSVSACLLQMKIIKKKKRKYFPFMAFQCLKINIEK